MKLLVRWTFVFLLAATLAVAAGAQDVESEADCILRAMGEYLKAAEEFSFELEVVYDTFSDVGQELQYGGHVSASVRRPDGFRVRFDGDERRNQLVFDAGTLTMLDERTNLYAGAEIATVVYVGTTPYYYANGVYYVPTDAPAQQPPPQETTVNVSVDSVDNEHAGVEMIDDEENYEVVAPPVGATVPYLPDEAQEETIGGKKYFVYADTYYRPFVSDGETIYMVVEEPRSA